MYDSFLTLLFRMMLIEKGSPDQTADALTPHLIENSSIVRCLGDDQVVKRYADFKALGVNNSDSKQLVIQMGKITVATRMALGYSNKGLSEKDVLRLFINDLDNAL